MNKSGTGVITSLSTILTATIFLLFPLFFLTTTTDFFTFPKQILIVIGSLVLFVMFGIKAVMERKVTILMNPLNVPILAFAAILILSTIFSIGPFDAVLQSLPVILLAVFFFTTVNFLQDRASFVIAVTCLIIGSAAATLLSVLANFNIYVLPFEQLKNTGFNTHGSPIQYAAFIVPLLIMCAASVYTLLKRKRLTSMLTNWSNLLQVLAGIIFAVGLGIVIYQIANAPQKPILLPFNHGFQVAFASISQDEQRLAQSLLLGSGYGTFSADFTRFVAPTFNQYPFWNLTFAFSSSYILELLATTGILGVIALAFIFVSFLRSRASASNPYFLATLSVFALALLIPFSFSMVFLLFALLSLFAAYRGIENARGYENVTLNFVAFKQGFISMNEEHSKKNRQDMLFPAIILALGIIGSIFILFYLVGSGGQPRKGYLALINSDIKFANSFSPTALQSGTQTYDLQTEALSEYPYRSDYYRLFSQINLALAANIVAAQQGRQPTEEVQNNIIALLQQSINSARQAVTLSPYSSLNWQNLGQIYRNLIGVGENAEQFAVASLNQAILLHPSNPGLRIELGGIYYQLQQWDMAQNAFTVATQIKGDYANAYYNLGHALEEKGDLQNALLQYQAVQQLVANDKPNLDKVTAEIAALQEKIGNQAQLGDETKEPTQDNTPLNVNQPQAEFPERDPRVDIPEPPAGQPTPTPTGTETE